MELALAPTMRREQSLAVSPALVASAQMLALGAADLADTVRRELDENPALERAEHGRACGSPLGDGEWPSAASMPAGSRQGCASGRARERRLPVDAIGNLPERSSDAERLLAELRLALPAAEYSIAEALVASLDERGYLTAAPSAVAGWLGADPARVERALVELRAIGPAGIAARDLRECLLLQLDRCAEAPALARAVVSEHLHALAAGRYGAIARALGVERERIVDARDFIRRTLRPAPAFASAESAVCRTPPDAIVEERAGVLRVLLTEPERFALRVCPLYVRIAEHGTAAERRHALPLAARAREFTGRLEQRWDTMLRVMRLAVNRQAEWVLCGRGPRRPLTRVEVARALSLHESTVSRATRERSMQLPNGRVIAVSELFVSNDDGREALRALLDEEQRALTDSELADALAARGHPLARRTVAKYRAQLGRAPHTLR